MTNLSWMHLKSFHEILNMSTDQLANNIETKITKLVNKHAPFKNIRVRPTRKPWITRELIKLIYTKNRLFNETKNNVNQWESYKEFRKYVLLKIRHAKMEYYTRLIKDSKTHEIWNVMNQLNDKVNKSKDISELFHQGKMVTEPIDIANNLNDFFCNVGKKINNDLKLNYQSNIDKWSYNPNGFKFQPITEQIVYKILMSLPNNKKGGTEQIPTYIYKILGPFIIEPMTNLINQIISSNTFPMIWKEALVTPIPKPGNKTDPSNQRPISSLLILSKITEKVLAYQIRNYLEINSLISTRQYGFRQYHSTQSLLLQLTNKWLKTLDKTTGDKYVCLTALDIKKAFDSVDHELIISKMCNLFEFHSSSIRLMISYLTSRSQRVKTNGIISTNMHVLSGVPQGSVLGPILFIMFVNDLANTYPCYLFADDCIIEQYGTTPTVAIENSNLILPSIVDWYKSNLIKLNTNKTSVIMLTNRPIDTNCLIPVMVNGNIGTFSHSMKYLGIWLDPALNWNMHIEYVKSKIMPLVWKFSQIRQNIDQSTAKLYYTSLLRPQLEYAATVIFNLSSTNSKTLETIQNRCLRIITQSPLRTSAANLRDQLKIPTLQNRRKYLYLCEVFKMRNNINPAITPCLNVSHTTRYNMRSKTSSKIPIPRMNKSVGQRSLDYLGAITYNTLPDYIKTITHYNTFKKQLRAHLLY